MNICGQIHHKNLTLYIVPWFSNLSEGERADCSSPPPVYNTSYGAPHTGSGVHKCSSYGGCCLVLLAIAALVAVGVGVMQYETIVAIFRHEGMFT